MKASKHKRTRNSSSISIINMPCEINWPLGWGFCGSDSKESSWNAMDPGSIPGLGRSPGEGNGYPLQYSCLEFYGERIPGLQSMGLQSRAWLRTERLGWADKFCRILTLRYLNFPWLKMNSWDRTMLHGQRWHPAVVCLGDRHCYVWSRYEKHNWDRARASHVALSLLSLSRLVSKKLLGWT